jgi:hypothetical protein
MVPGGDPFDELVPALLQVATLGAEEVRALLSEDHRGLARTVKAIVPPGSALVLLVDQFEELFTLTTAEPARRRFLDALEHAVIDQRCPIRVILTLRADFYDRPLRYGAFARLLRDATVPVLPLAPDELERAIVDPAARVGAAFEPGLVSRIVADVADQPAALPVLQYTLTELYERRVSGVLTVAEYERLGGVAGAIAQRAEQLHAACSPAEKAAARRLFTSLVHVGEGEEDTRRRARRAELGRGEAMASVLERFGEARLLGFDREVATREPTVEVAHEALLREWPRLRSWLDADRDAIRAHRHLTEAAATWRARGSDASELYRGGRLDLALEWLAGHPDEPSEAERAFLDASVERRDAEAARERRRITRLRALLAGVAVALVVALVAGAVAFAQQRRADRNADRTAAALLESQRSEAAAQAATRVADLNRLQAEAKAIASTNRRLAMLLALEANRIEDTPATRSTVLHALADEARFLGAYPMTGTTLAGMDVVGDTVVGVSVEGWLHEWDLATRELRRPPVQLTGIELPLVPRRCEWGAATSPCTGATAA